MFSRAKLWFKYLIMKPNPNQELRQYSLFKELNDHELHLVHNSLHTREFKAGDTIFEENFPLEVVYFIAAGEVQLSSLSGKQTMSVLKEHECMGLIDLFGKHHRTLTAKAVSDVTLLAFSQTEFWGMVQKDKALGIKLLTSVCGYLSKRLQETE